MNRSHRNSEKNYLSSQGKMAANPLPNLKYGGTSGKALVKIVDPGASWRGFFRAVPTIKAVIAIFPFLEMTKEFFVSAGDIVKL